MFNRNHTILLITRQVLARIDLRGRKRFSVKQIWTAPSRDYDTILPEVARVIKLGKHALGRVTIVSPDFWTDILSIPPDVAAIASENEINQALALEAEVDSGLSAFDSRTSVMQIADLDDRSENCQWCVSQVQLEHIQELSHALRTFGGKLHSVAHPIIAQLISAERFSVESVQGLLDTWRDLATLGTDELQTLASAWATCLSQTPPHPLLVLNARELTPTSKPLVMTASLALLAAGGCGLWHWQTQKSLTLATQAIEQIEKQQSKHEASEASLKNTEASAVQLGQEVVKTQAIRQIAERQLHLAGVMHLQHNRRWLALVDALAESASETCWVQKIESNSVQVVVHGLALDNAAANGFAGRLELELKGSGWRTAPAATGVSPHNLVAFQIVLIAMLKPVDDAHVNPQITLKQNSSVAPNALVGSTQP